MPSFHYLFLMRNPDLGSGIEDGDFVSIIESPYSPAQMPLIHKDHWNFHTILMKPESARDAKERLAEAGMSIGNAQPPAGGFKKFGAADRVKVVSRLDRALPVARVKPGIIPQAVRLRLKSQRDHSIIADREYTWDEVVELYDG